MRKIILIVLLFFSISHMVNALPIPALVLWYEFILLAVPTVLWFFTLILFYFRKYLFWINLYLFIWSIVLYIIHFYITNEVFIFEYEYLLFWVFIFIWVFSYKYKCIQYGLVLLLMILHISFLKIDHNLYAYKTICNKSKNIDKSFSFNYCEIKDNNLIINFDNLSNNKEIDIWIYKWNIYENKPAVTKKWYSFEYRTSRGDCGTSCMELLEKISNNL